MKWQEGRQGTGYLKKKLLGSNTFDCYLLKYEKGTHIPRHKDPVHVGRHFRINIELWKASKGGIFEASDIIFKIGIVVMFRPDIYDHSVSKIEEGTRYVLSIGWIRE